MPFCTLLGFEPIGFRPPRGVAAIANRARGMGASEEEIAEAVSVAYNGATIGDGRVPGPITQRLTSAFSDLAGMDYVPQYLSHLPAESQ
jgi:hypothetical protein